MRGKHAFRVRGFADEINRRTGLPRTVVAEQSARWVRHPRWQSEIRRSTRDSDLHYLFAIFCGNPKTRRSASASDLHCLSVPWALSVAKFKSNPRSVPSSVWQNPKFIGSRSRLRPSLVANPSPQPLRSVAPRTPQLTASDAVPDALKAHQTPANIEG